MQPSEPAGRGSAAQRGERGFATVAMAGWLGFLTVAGSIALLAAGVAAAQHHLDAAADLAALSGATAARSGQDGCEVAQRSADGNGADLRSCRLDGADVVVTVAGAIDLPFGVDGSMTATARAGP